jgi:1-acyl-sn-glycerol-3-phosphate acyltransferase
MTGALLADAVRLFTGAQARWQGCAPAAASKPRIYFANHVSNLDFVLIWSSLPPPLRRRTRPAAAHDYWSAPAWRRRIAENIFHAVLIERHKITRDNHPVNQLAAVIDAGDSIIIFPEGTRNPDPRAPMAEFKTGLHHLAHRCPAADLIPVYLENLSRVLPKGEWLPLPILCSVTFGPPLDRLERESKPDFLRRARDAVAALAAP